MWLAATIFIFSIPSPISAFGMLGRNVIRSQANKLHALSSSSIRSSLTVNDPDPADDIDKWERMYQ